MHQLEFHQLVIKDFKGFKGQHELVLWDGNPGLFFIKGVNKDNPEMGANGAGKSTIFDALFWVLWGKTIRDARPADEVVPWVGGQTKVAFKFKRNGKTFCLERTRKPNSLGLLEGKKERREIVQEDVPIILGMNEETFRRTIVLGQFGTFFLDLKPEAQSQMFSDALNLQVWLDAAANAKKQAADEDKLLALAKDEAATIRGRKAEAEAQRDRELKNSRAWKAEQGLALDELRADVAAGKAELAKLSQTEPERPLVDLGNGFEELLGEARKAEAARRAECLDLKVALRERLTNEKAIKAKLASYDQTKTCPECGQPISEKDSASKIVRLKRELQDLCIKKWEEDVDKAVGALNKATDRIQKLEAQRSKALAGSATIVAAHSAWLRKKQRAEDDLAASEAQLKKQLLQQNPFENALQQTDERLQKLDVQLGKAEAAIVSGEALKADYEYWAAAFKEIRLKLLDEALLELEIAACRHAEALGLNEWRIEFATERSTKSGSVSIGFSVVLYPPGKDKPVKWESYCGGEVQRWQLAVAFALSEVLLARAGLSPNVEIFDEPTRGLSPEGIASLLDQLRERATALNKSIFLVDHHALSTGGFDGVLKVTMEDGRSSFDWA